MEVRINDNPIDVRLENETNALEVLRQLDQWLLSERFFISSVLINGTATSPSDTAVLEKIQIADVNLFDITAMPLDEMVYEGFATLLDYFTFLYRGIKENNTGLLADLYNEFPHILSSIDYILDLKVGSKPVSEALKNLFEGFSAASDGIHAKEGLAEFIENLCYYIEGRIREIANPLIELKAAASLMQAQIPGLEEIPILLQTGKERKAMEMIITFTEIHEKLTRLFPLLKEKELGDILGSTIEGLSFMDFYKDLNLKFQELIEAMEAEDSILFGDLLEYEIAPKIGTLTETINGMAVFSGSVS